jgi:cell division protein FtsI/penicillin-binding protein 2
MESESSWKYWLFNGGLLLSLGIVLVGVIRLSIIKQKYYSMLARENRVNEMVIPAARGKIVDRKGRIVAKSVYQYFKKEGEEKIYQGDGDFEGYKFEGNDLAYDLKRQYYYGEAMGLLTGYVGKVNNDDLNSGECGC